MLALALLACASKSPTPAAPSAPADGISEMLPPPYDALLVMGGPMELNMSRLPGAVEPEGNVFDFRRVVEHTPDSGPVAAATLYFDTDTEGQPLYEIIAEMKPEVDVNAWAAERWGPPNAGEEWAHPSPEGFEARAWTYQNRAIVVAALPGTEWNE